MINIIKTKRKTMVDNKTYKLKIRQDETHLKQWLSSSAKLVSDTYNFNIAPLID